MRRPRSGLLVVAAACAASLAAARAVAASAMAAVASPDAYGADAVTYPEAGNLGGGGFATLVMHGRP